MIKMETAHVIETHGLGKDYGSKTAVADLSISVRPGEVFGFLGPNGAGKTTSVKMLLGLVLPTRGSGTLLGKPIGQPAARADVGFLPEHFRFHGWMTGREFLRLHGNLKGIARSDLETRIPELLELVGLSEAGEKKLRAYSKGMLQRIGLAQALLNEPSLVILDEPTSGLDPLGRRLVRDIIRDLKDLGKAVFINSHLLSEIEVTCDRVAFIREGSIVRTVDLAGMDGDMTVVNIHAASITEAALNGLRGLANGVDYQGGVLKMVLSDRSLVPQINRYLVEQNVEVFAIQPERTSLEDLFIEIMGTRMVT